MSMQRITELLVKIAQVMVNHDGSPAAFGLLRQTEELLVDVKAGTSIDPSKYTLKPNEIVNGSITERQHLIEQNQRLRAQVEGLRQKLEAYESKEPVVGNAPASVIEATQDNTLKPNDLSEFRLKIEDKPSFWCGLENKNNETEFFVVRPAGTPQKLVLEGKEAIEAAVTRYWEQHYRGEDGVCILCRDAGSLHAVKFGNGLYAGSSVYCICLTGQRLRKQAEDKKSENQHGQNAVHPAKEEGQEHG